MAIHFLFDMITSYREGTANGVRAIPGNVRSRPGCRNCARAN